MTKIPNKNEITLNRFKICDLCVTPPMDLDAAVILRPFSADATTKWPYPRRFDLPIDGNAFIAFPNMWKVIYS